MDSILMNNMTIFPPDMQQWTDGHLIVVPLTMMWDTNGEHASVWVRNERDGSKLNFSYDVFLRDFHSPV